MLYNLLPLFSSCAPCCLSPLTSLILPCCLSCLINSSKTTLQSSSTNTNPNRRPITRRPNYSIQTKTTKHIINMHDLQIKPSILKFRAAILFPSFYTIRLWNPLRLLELLIKYHARSTASTSILRNHHFDSLFRPPPFLREFYRAVAFNRIGDLLPDYGKEFVTVPTASSS
jgi:hypothetical protein